MYQSKIKTVAFAALVMAAAVITSCGKKVEGSGNVVSETRTVPAFTDIEMSGSYNLVLTHDSVQKVVVKTDDNIMSDVKTRVDDGELEIYFDCKNCNYEPTFMTVYISSPNIDDVDLSGSGNISSTNTLIANEPEYNLSGSGDIDISVNANKVETKLSGSGNITLAGSSPQSQHRISGSGKIAALNLDSDNVTVNISGSGDAFVNANTTLNATISGSGNVRYTGSPEVTTNISGSGNVAPY
jgi:Putative auto-transporter adhesin, head GIN domain